MSKLPILAGREPIKILERMGFQTLRMEGSHVCLMSGDGRYTTVPIHSGKMIPKGLLRKIIREDLKISLDEFIKNL